MERGLKTVEGRLWSSVMHLQPADLIRFKCGKRHIICEVKYVNQYPTFYAMLEKEGLSKVLPGLTTIEEGVETFATFYDDAVKQGRSIGAIGVKVKQTQSAVQRAKTKLDTPSITSFLTPRKRAKTDA